MVSKSMSVSEVGGVLLHGIADVRENAIVTRVIQCEGRHGACDRTRWRNAMYDEIYDEDLDYHAVPVVRRPSPGLAAVLSVILPGLGHVYAGRMAAGLATDRPRHRLRYSLNVFIVTSYAKSNRLETRYLLQRESEMSPPNREKGTLGREL